MGLKRKKYKNVGLYCRPNKKGKFGRFDCDFGDVLYGHPNNGVSEIDILEIKGDDDTEITYYKDKNEVNVSRKQKGYHDPTKSYDCELIEETSGKFRKRTLKCRRSK